jgi:mono/diheme cytochrome c family protein
MRRTLALIGFLAIIVAVGAGVFFFGGYYTVAATEPDPGIVAWALVRVRDASIDRHATATPPFSLDDPNAIQDGARAFAEQGCANCHGAPGVKWAKFSEGLRPDPPDLADAAKELEPREIFWVVKNGINMTGMPSFARVGMQDQDIWKIAAFVKKLPSVSETDFKNWTTSAPAAAAPATPAPAAPAPAQQ